MDDSQDERERGRPIDTLIWSSAWISTAVAALAYAASLAMGLEPDAIRVGLAYSGTVVVYVLDHLRDLERDRATSPLRSAFVARYRFELITVLVVCAVASVGLGWLAGPRVVLVAAAVLAMGLLHRRVRHLYLVKAAYIAVSVSAVTVGFPWVSDGSAQDAIRVAAIVALTVQANVVLYNLRDGMRLAGRHGRRPVQAVELLLLACAAALALTGSGSVLPLVCLPAAMAAALIGFRPTERYGAWAVDGALLVGALAAILVFAVRG